RHRRIATAVGIGDTRQQVVDARIGDLWSRWSCRAWTGLRRRRDHEDVVALLAGDVMTDVAAAGPQTGLAARAGRRHRAFLRPRLDRRAGADLARAHIARLVRLFSPERHITLLADDQLTDVSAPDPQAGRAVRANRDEVRLDVVHGMCLPLRQDRPPSNP